MGVGFLGSGLRRNDGGGALQWGGLSEAPSPFPFDFPQGERTRSGLAQGERREGRFGSGQAQDRLRANGGRVLSQGEHVFRRSGGGRNPGRSAARCRGGSSDTMGRCSSERSVVKAGLVPGLGFLDCGLRRNDGWGAWSPAWVSWVPASAGTTKSAAAGRKPAGRNGWRR